MGDAARRAPSGSRDIHPIASNQAFSGWTNTFTEPRLCAAITDRLTFAGLIIETGTGAYRLDHAKAQRAAAG